MMGAQCQMMGQVGTAWRPQDTGLMTSRSHAFLVLGPGSGTGVMCTRKEGSSSQNPQGITGQPVPAP